MDIPDHLQRVVLKKQLHAAVMAGYNHSIANIMTAAALRTGERVTFDDARREVLAGEVVFKYYMNGEK